MNASETESDEDVGVDADVSKDVLLELDIDDTTNEKLHPVNE